MDQKVSKPLESTLQVIRESEDAAAVRSAIMELGYEKSPDVYPILVERLNDPNPSIQHAAVISLGRYGRPEAVDELIKPKIFRSSGVNIRWAAVAAVGKLGDYRVIDDLIKAAEDPEWIVRTQAFAELKTKVQDIIGRKDIRLARILIHMLSLENEEIVDLAIEGFLEIGQESLHLLHGALNNSSASIRTNAARALGKFRSHQSTPYLLELLHDQEWPVRASAAEALGLIGDKAAIEAVIQKIQDHVEKVRDQAGEAIVRFGRQATIPLLNALAREKDKFSERALLKCLGKIGDPKSVPALLGCLRSSYFIVRQSAVAALVRFGPAVVNSLLPALSYNRSDIEPLLKDACDRLRPELQLRAIKALGGLEDHRALKMLKQLVDESPPDIQEAAVQALSQIGCAAWGRCCALKVLAEVGDAALIPQVRASLQDHSDNVRFEAVRALARIGGPAAVQDLVRMAKTDECDFIRAESVRMLRTVGIGQPGVLEAAVRALKDRARQVRRQGARLLGNFQDKKSIQPLLKAMADPHWSVRESAENALLNFGRDAVKPLIAALESASWTTRFRAARLLGEIKDSRAIPALKKILAKKKEKREVREIAEKTLHKLQNKKGP